MSSRQTTPTRAAAPKPRQESSAAVRKGRDVALWSAGVLGCVFFVILAGTVDSDRIALVLAAVSGGATSPEGRPIALSPQPAQGSEPGLCDLQDGNPGYLCREDATFSGLELEDFDEQGASDSSRGKVGDADSTQDEATRGGADDQADSGQSLDAEGRLLLQPDDQAGEAFELAEREQDGNLPASSESDGERGESAEEEGRERADLAAQTEFELVEERFPAGQLRSEGELLDGYRTGTWREWFENGRPDTVAEYDREGERAGEWRSWYENGSPRAQGRYLQGQRHGHWIQWHQNGVRKSEVDYRMGRREGFSQEWYSSGQSKEAGNYREGRREGYWQFFNFQGLEDRRTGHYELGRRLR